MKQRKQKTLNTKDVIPSALKVADLALASLGTFQQKAKILTQ